MNEDWTDYLTLEELNFSDSISGDMMRDER